MMILSRFTKSWSAICPQCNHLVTQDDFTCKECGNGKIKAREGDGYYSLYFGCDMCDEEFLLIICPKCRRKCLNRDARMSWSFNVPPAWLNSNKSPPLDVRFFNLKSILLIIQIAPCQRFYITILPFSCCCGRLAAIGYSPIRWNSIVCEIIDISVLVCLCHFAHVDFGS